MKNVKIGNITYNGIDTIRLKNADTNDYSDWNDKIPQEKTIAPTTAKQEISPDDGNYLSKVTISAIPTEIKTITDNGEVLPTDGKFLSKVTVNVPKGIPIEISTSNEMFLSLSSENVGKIYKFTGTTDDDFTNGELYEVVAPETVTDLTDMVWKYNSRWNYSGSVTGTVNAKLIQTTGSSLSATSIYMKRTNNGRSRTFTSAYFGDKELGYSYLAVDLVDIDKYPPDASLNSEYRNGVIIISDGTSVTNTSFISWLKANGTVLQFKHYVEDDGIDTSDATATATDIASGKTAYVDGNKVTGSLPEYTNSADKYVPKSWVFNTKRTDYWLASTTVYMEPFTCSGIKYYGLRYGRGSYTSSSGLSDYYFLRYYKDSAKITYDDVYDSHKSSPWTSSIYRYITFDSAPSSSLQSVLNKIAKPNGEASFLFEISSAGETAFSTKNRIFRKNMSVYPKLQEKSATPTSASQSITADSGYAGLAKVTVAATPLEERAGTPKEVSQTFTPNSGYVGMSSFQVEAVETEDALFVSNGTYSANTGKFYKEVTVNVQPYENVTTSAAMDAKLVAANVGKVYRADFTSDDGRYIFGDLYEVVSE